MFAFALVGKRPLRSEIVEVAFAEGSGGSTISANSSLSARTELSSPSIARSRSLTLISVERLKQLIAALEQ